MTTREPVLLPLAVDGLSPAWMRMLEQEGVPTIDLRSSAPQPRFVLFDGRRRKPPCCSPSRQAVDVSLFEFDVSPTPISADVAPKVCRAFWRIGAWQAGEEVAAVDHRAVRALLLGRLRQALCERGGIWMRISPYPWPYRTAANFRFDHDAYDAADFHSVMDAIDGREAMTTHFVCAASHESQSEALARLRGLDVGSHGYRHHTYRSASENIINIRRGCEALQRCGLEPRGFAAPHGRYLPGLAVALAELGIGYSSEFGAAYDELPFHPEGSTTLQLPIHPVCLGIVLEAMAPGCEPAAVAEAVCDYFAEVVTEKYHAGEPLFFYGHPDQRIGRYPNVLRRLFAEIDGLSDVWRTSLSEWTRWWRERNRCRWSVRGTPQQPELCVDSVPQSFSAAVEWFNGASSTLLPLRVGRNANVLSEIAFRAIGSLQRSLPCRRTMPHGVRNRIRRWLDWEYETPIEEIDVRGWRGRIKRSLRRLKEAGR